MVFIYKTLPNLIKCASIFMLSRQAYNNIGTCLQFAVEEAGGPETIIKPPTSAVC